LQYKRAQDKDIAYQRGVWAHPIKLMTGYWFALDGAWLPPARRFTSGTGYVQFELPQLDGIDITRLEFLPMASQCCWWR
jgi:hypothetical protein